MTDALQDQDPVIEKMDKDEMFISAMDSPTDSGLETNKTSNSDTMEDLSLQVRDKDGALELEQLLNHHKIHVCRMTRTTWRTISLLLIMKSILMMMI